MQSCVFAQNFRDQLRQRMPFAFESVSKRAEFIYSNGSISKCYIEPIGLHGSTVQAFLAGILDHLPGILAITCPSVNSYHRMVENFWAGVYKCWGVDKKEAPLRLTTDTVSKCFNKVELEAIDSTANPHLALAVLIAAGLDGIERQLPLQPPTIGNPADLSEQDRIDCGIERLPASLPAALAALESDPVLCKTLGHRYLQVYLAVRRSEEDYFSKSKSFQDQVAMLLTRY